MRFVPTLPSRAPSRALSRVGSLPQPQPIPGGMRSAIRRAPQSHLGTWWTDNSGQVITGVVTAVLSAIAVYFVMRSVEKKR